MISAFGIEHELSKNLEEGAMDAARAAKKAAKAARPRLSPEDIERLKAERAGRIERGEAQAPPEKKERQDPNAQMRAKTTVPFFQGNQPKHLAIGIPVGVGTLAVGHHITKKPKPTPPEGSVVKSHKGDAAAVAAGTVGGSFGLDQVDTLAGATLKRVGHSQRQNAGALSDSQKQSLETHQRAHGFVTEHGQPRHPVSADSHATKNHYFRTYPKDLPASRVQRLNAARDAVEGRPVMAAGAAAGAGYMALRVHRKNKATKIAGPVAKADKSKEHAEEAGAAAVGGGAGQGGYQAAGYAAKKRVDLNTRKQHGRVSPEQVKAQDKALRANKSSFGMHLPAGHPERDNVAYHRNYPKELPYAREVRTLGHTHEGHLGAGVGTAVTLAGAAGAAGLVHHHKKKELAVAKSAFGVVHKAYTPGTITYHAENARMHSRKKTSGYRQVTAGAVVGGVGAAAHFNADAVAHGIKGDNTVVDAAKTAKFVRRAGIGGMAVGGGLVALGGARAIYHGHKQNKEAKKAQAARVERSKELEEREMAKSAFGVEIGKGALESGAKLGRIVANNESEPGMKAARKVVRAKKVVMAREANEARGLHRTATGETDLSFERGFRSTRKGDHDYGSLAQRRGDMSHNLPVAKSAFLDEPVEKFALGSVLDMGSDALKGLKSGLGGWHETGSSAKGASALKAGQMTGRGLKTAGIKLKPLTSTPVRTAATAGGAGLGAGVLLGNKSNN